MVGFNKKIMKKRILILGSGGQIGAYLTDYLNKRGYEVLEFDVVNGLHQDMTEICLNKGRKILPV